MEKFSVFRSQFSVFLLSLQKITRGRVQLPTGSDSLRLLEGAVC